MADDSAVCWGCLAPLVMVCWGRLAPLVTVCWGCLAPLVAVADDSAVCWGCLAPLVAVCWGHLAPLVAVCWGRLAPLVAVADDCVVCWGCVAWVNTEQVSDAVCRFTYVAEARVCLLIARRLRYTLGELYVYENKTAELVLKFIFNYGK